MPRVAIGAAIGVVSWVAASVAWHLAAGGTTGLAVGRWFPLLVSCWDVGCSEQLEFGCVLAYCFPIAGSPGMDCVSDYLCGNVDVRFKWGVSFAFLVPFQENRLSGLELVFFCSMSLVMVRLQFLFVFAVSFPDCFVPAGSLCWVVVKSGTDCSIHEGFIWCGFCGGVRCLAVCLKHVIGCFMEINAFCTGDRSCFVHELVKAFYLSLGFEMSWRDFFVCKPHFCCEFFEVF